MGFLTRDLNRSRKQYPPTRRKQRLTLVSETELFLESGTITFDNQLTGSYSYQNDYSSAPTVFCSSYSSTDGLVNINLIDVTTEGATVEASDRFTGTVYIQVLQLGS